MKKKTYTLILSLLFAIVFTLYTSLEKKEIISYSKDIIPEYNDLGKVSIVLALLFFKEIIENPSIIPI